jgi:O-antigen/teichoic acid export membrane protein
LLIPGTIGFAIGRPVFAISYAKGDMRVLIAATAVAAVGNLALNAFLIPTYGMYGAAVATSLGYLSLPLAHVWGAHRLGYDPFNDFRLPRIAATVVLAALPIAALSYAVQNQFLALLVVPPVGFAVYSVLAVATGAVRVQELRELAASLPSPVDRWAAGFDRRISGSTAWLAVGSDGR